MPSGLELLDALIVELESSVATLQVTDSNPPPAPTSSADKAENSKEGKAKKEKKEAKPNNNNKQQKATATTTGPERDPNAPLNVNDLDLRVGVIVKVSKHETAEKLYCEEIDVGEDAPRAIASGLVPYYTLEQMEGKKLFVVCNLKPRNLVGFKSNGMVLCASKTNADGTNSVEFVDPPADSKPGDRLVGEGLSLVEPMTASKCDKTKAFETIAADLRVDSEGVAFWKDVKLVVNGTPCSAPTVRDAPIR